MTLKLPQSSKMREDALLYGCIIVQQALTTKKKEEA